LRVLRGGSAESAAGRWVKFDVELDESDYQQLLIENGFDTYDLTVVQKFNLLVKYAELLVTIRMEDLQVKGDHSASELLSNLKTYIHNLKVSKGS